MKHNRDNVAFVNTDVFLKNQYAEWIVALTVTFVVTFDVTIGVLNIISPPIVTLINIIRVLTLIPLLMFQIRHYGIQVKGKKGLLFFVFYTIYIYFYLELFPVYKIEDLKHVPPSLFHLIYYTVQILILLLCAETIIRHLNVTKFLFLSFFTSVLPSILIIQFIGVEVFQIIGQQKDDENYVSILALGYGNGPLLVLSIIFFKRMLKNKLLSMFFATIIILMTSYVILMCGERGPIVWSFMSLVICFFLLAKKISRYIVWTFILGVILYINVDFVLLGLSQLAPRTAERVELTITEGDTSHRFDTDDEEGSTYIIAWNQFLSSPIYGSYFRLITNTPSLRGHYPHNVFLEIMITMGLVGFIPFLFMLYKAWRTVRKTFKQKQYTEGQLVCLVFFLSVFLQLQTTETIVTYQYFWLFFYIICNFTMINEKNSSKVIKFTKGIR